MKKVFFITAFLALFFATGMSENDSYINTIPACAVQNDDEWIEIGQVLLHHDGINSYDIRATLYYREIVSAGTVIYRVLYNGRYYAVSIQFDRYDSYGKKIGVVVVENVEYFFYL